MVEKDKPAVQLAPINGLQWQRLFNMFYIEPVIFMLVFSHMLSGTVFRNQIIYQTCTVIFQFNETDCKHLDDKNASAEIKDMETQLQSYVANMFLTTTLFESIVPAICGLFIGSWSDHYGRKPLLAVSMIGFSSGSFISAVICGLSSYYVINPWWYTLAAVPRSLLGGMCVFFVASLCFISDITDPETRPYRMIFLELVLFVALTSGSLISGYLYAVASAATIKGISCFIICLATLFVLCFVPETLSIFKEQKKALDIKEKENYAPVESPTGVRQVKIKLVLPTDEDEKPLKYDESLTEKPQVQAETPTKPLPEKEDEKIGLFNLKHVKDMFSTCMKEREHNARSIIWLVTLAGFLSIFAVDGAGTVTYLFVRQKFHWTVPEYTFYEGFSQSVPMIGAVLGVLVLRKIFGLSVIVLTLVALLSEISCDVTKGFAMLPWHLYLSVGLGVFRSIRGPMCRTIISNIVPASDMGKIFSISNVVHSFAPFVAAPLYTAIYQRTLTTNPGLFNLLNAGLYVLAFVFICGVLHIKLKHKAHYAETLK